MEFFSANYLFLIRWLHVLSGVMWIGLLWYFNFVQIPTMPKVPAELKPGVSKYIAPEALFWFRYAALSTVFFGLWLGYANGYIHTALALGAAGPLTRPEAAIGIGMWFGIIMAFNVWVFIWPAQQKALGLVEADADTKTKAARTAMLFSRTNTMLSIPMLYCMVAYQNLQ